MERIETVFLKYQANLSPITQHSPILSLTSLATIALLKIPTINIPDAKKPIPYSSSSHTFYKDISINHPNILKLSITLRNAFNSKELILKMHQHVDLSIASPSKNSTKSTLSLDCLQGYNHHLNLIPLATGHYDIIHLRYLLQNKISNIALSLPMMLSIPDSLSKDILKTKLIGTLFHIPYIKLISTFEDFEKISALCTSRQHQAFMNAMQHALISLLKILTRETPSVVVTSYMLSQQNNQQSLKKLVLEISNEVQSLASESLLLMKLFSYPL